MHRLTVTTGSVLKGDLRVPPSKYHEHRALLLAALADGPSTIVGSSRCRHVDHTVRALRSLGTGVRRLRDGYVVTPGPWRASTVAVPVGSSGTTLYLLAGLLHRCSGGAVTVTGQRSLGARPIGPLLDALRQAGVRIESAGSTSVPLRVRPGPLRGGPVDVAGLLSQWVSALLVAAPFAREPLALRVHPPRNEQPYVDLTVAMLRHYGVTVEAAPDEGRYTVATGQRYRAADIELPADYSSLAFPLAAAALLPDSDVTLHGRFSDDHPEREIVDLLAAMNADVTVAPDQRSVRARGGRPLHGIRVDCRRTPDLLPILAVVATQARGRTVFEHVAHIRRKECDRVHAMVALRAMGARVEESPDALVVHGPARLTGTDIATWNDHRVQMAFAVAGLVAAGATSLSHPYAFRVSYPTFVDDMNLIGAGLKVVR